MSSLTMVSRGNGRSNNNNNNKRRGGSRADRDGDVLMNISSQTRARVGKGPKQTPNRQKDLIPKGPKSHRVLSNSAQRAITLAAGDVKTKAERPNRLVQIKITGWDKSKASDAQDNGVSSLIKWIEKKASSRLGSKSRAVRIQQSLVEGTDLIISVRKEDEIGIMRLNGFAWAAAKLHFERMREASPPASTSQTEETKAMLRGVLERRYNPDLKLLDLSALGQDEELRAQAIFDAKSTASKFFPAMMRVLEMSFDSKTERDAAVESVSLANNELPNLTSVTTLSQTLTNLKNLDLSNNKFESLSVLSNWRKRFYHLEQLILSNNPLEQNEPNYAQEIISWYPNLRMLNNIQVRTEEEVAQKSKIKNLPFHIRSPVFQDDHGIAEGFVRNFFAGMDSDRALLVSTFYDDHSSFSLAVNSNSTKHPDTVTEKHEWEDYIRDSRNLKKINHLSARINRLHKTTESISKAFATMPKTVHPDLATEPKKWMIEAHMQPCVPDPINNTPSGVDGFYITIHCEFDETNANTTQTTKKRSADHNFIIGPNGNGGVRVHSHQVTIRAYGGTQAFEPEEIEAWHGAPEDIPQQIPQLPAGISIEIAEQMVVELSKQTNMTVDFSRECLEQVGWDFNAARSAFERVKGQLPPTAFNPPTL